MEDPVNRCQALITPTVFFGVALLCFAWIAPAGAEEKSIYTPIIQIDKEKGQLLISNSGAVFYVQAGEAAKPHLEKLPLSGLIDIVIETQASGPPIIKSWKLASGDSTCKVFDGQACK